jgi:ketosteroid isomerase-like protein
LFTEFAQTAETEQFEPREFIAQGERAVVLGHRRDRVRATGRIFESDRVQVFSLSEGKVVRFQGYIDTAAKVAAFRGDC